MISMSKNRLRIIGGVLLLVIVGIGTAIALTPSVPPFLRVIYPYFSIEALPEPHHYTFGENDFYAKELLTGGKKVYVVVQRDTGNWVSYQFFSEDGEEMESVLSLMWPNDHRDAFEKYIGEKDITGDGRAELFVQENEIEGQSKQYTILTWVDDKLIALSYPGERGPTVEFDDIGYENGYVWMTWHDPGRTGIHWDAISGNSLVMRKWMHSEPISEGSKACYIRELNPSSVGWQILATEENCESAGTRYEKYWTPTADPKIEAAQALRYKLPVDERAIDALVDTYYDLTMFYGASGDYSLLGEEPRFFVDAYFHDGDNWDDRVLWMHEIYKLAFVPPGAPAASYEMSWPTGPGSGGNIVGRKNIDENTVLAYGVHYWQAYMGPSAGLCKEGGMSVDKFIFKKIKDEWWLWEVEESIDRWQTHNEGKTEEECKPFNQDRIKKYQSEAF